MSDTEEGLDPAIAAAMGFASFGGAPATKKRKVQDNSFVEGQDTREAQQRYGSSANTTALGPRRPRNNDGSAVEQNATGDAGDAATGARAKKARANGPPSQRDGLAAFLSHGNSVSARPSGNFTQESSKADLDPEMAVQAVPKAVNGTQAATDADMDAYSLQDLQRGVVDAHGDMAYFLPSFLEDPWENLR